jgi:hypothetical protein
MKTKSKNTDKTKAINYKPLLCPVFDDYKIGDVVFTITNGQLVKTKIIKIYDNHIAVYSGDWMPYEKQYKDIAKTKEQLINQIKVDNLCDNADRWLNGA